MTFLTNVHKNNKPLTSFGASPFTTWLFGFRPLSVRLETNWGCILWCIVKGVYTSGKASKACQTTEPLLCKQTAFRFKIWKANMSILWDDCVTNEFGNDVYYTSYNKGRTILVDLSDVVYWFKKKNKKKTAPYFSAVASCSSHQKCLSKLMMPVFFILPPYFHIMHGLH